MGRAPQRVWRFDLDSVAYAESGAAVSARAERVRKVTDERGPRAGRTTTATTSSSCSCAEPAPPEKPVKLRFEIDGDFLVRPGGDSYWELGIRPWFPQPRLCGQYYTFHARHPRQEAVRAVRAGRDGPRAIAEGDENVLETRVDKPDPVARSCWRASTRSHEEARDGVTIRVATYAIKNPRGVKQLTDLAELVIGYYEKFLGPFPFPEYNIIEINDYGFGQAPPGIMFITSEAFNPLLGDMNQLFSQGINERFAHEIAHQYWGHVVKMPERRGAVARRSRSRSTARRSS